MKLIRSLAITTFILFVVMGSMVVSAGNSDIEMTSETIILMSEDEREIEVFEDEFLLEPVAFLPHETELLLIEQVDTNSDDQILYIQYLDDELDEEIEGYISGKDVVYEQNPEVIDSDEEIKLDKEESIVDEKDIIEEDEVQQPTEIKPEITNESEPSTEKKLISAQRLEGIALQSATNVYNNESKESKVLKTYSQGHILIFQDTESEWYEATVYVKGEKRIGYIHQDDVELINPSSEQLNGYALKELVSVYESPTRESKNLKDYQYGHLLKYQPFSTNWYIAVVYLKGERHTGYIHASDVGEKIQAPTVQGVALKSKTSVYEKTSKSSNILRSYNEGHILKFRAYNANWYEATVYIKGKRHTGFIYKDDVDLLIDSSEQVSGLAIKQPVSVYERPTVHSKSLKDYNYGSVLKYQSFSKYWYKATVYLNGSKHTGYISASDVSNNTQLPSIRGMALKNQTPVYSSTSKSSKILKSYRQGELLKYQAYNSEWYIATVFIQGVKHAGYIHKNDVDNLVTSSDPMSALALKQPVAVYGDTNQNSKILKEYDYGHALKFRTYSSQWYEAVVYVGGQRQTGYIRVADVGDHHQAPSGEGVALKNKTNVYKSASRSSTILKTYSTGHLLKYKAYNSNWYIATIIDNGVRQTGYLHKSDVETSLSSSHTLKGIGLNNKTHVYSQPRKNSKVHKSYREGHLLKYRTFTSEWYQATVFVNGEKIVGFIHKNDVLTSNGRTVVLDAGHGGNDPGARGNGIIEKDLTLDIAKRAKKVLENAGFNVIMTRSNDQFVELAERARIANSSRADLFISIHGNAFNGHAKGVETYWYDKYATDESKRLAEVLQEEVVINTNSTSRGVKKGNFHVIRETKMPSALLEVGFIDNKSDANNLKKSSFKDRIVDGILNAVKNFLKIF